MSCRVATELGDFVVAKKDGTAAYQLAVVVDDHQMQVTEVVRGDDLLASTYRQLQLYEAFGWQPPRFFHLPLLVGLDGKRLAKRHGDTRISTLRGQGIKASRIVGWLAHSLGLIETLEPFSADQLIDHFEWSKITADQPTTFSDQAIEWMTSG